MPRIPRAKSGPAAITTEVLVSVMDLEHTSRWFVYLLFIVCHRKKRAKTDAKDKTNTSQALVGTRLCTFVHLLTYIPNTNIFTSNHDYYCCILLLIVFVKEKINDTTKWRNEWDRTRVMDERVWWRHPSRDICIYCTALPNLIIQYLTSVCI